MLVLCQSAKEETDTQNRLQVLGYFRVHDYSFKFVPSTPLHFEKFNRFPFSINICMVLFCF